MMFSSTLLGALVGAMAIAGTSADYTATNVVNYCISASPGQVQAITFDRKTGLEKTAKYCSDYLSTAATSASQNVQGYIRLWHWSVEPCDGSEGTLISSEICTQYMQDAIDNCDLDTTDDKYGNSMIVDSADGACTNFTIYATFPYSPSMNSKQ